MSLWMCCWGDWREEDNDRRTWGSLIISKRPRAGAGEALNLTCLAIHCGGLLVRVRLRDSDTWVSPPERRTHWCLGRGDVLDDRFQVQRGSGEPVSAGLRSRVEESRNSIGGSG